jgi:hypothetical protein
MLTPQEAAQELQTRRASRESLLSFTEYTHGRFQPSWHHRLIAEKLEAVERGEIKRLMINMPPRHGKSEISTRRFPAWCIGRDPYRQVISASYNAQFARGIGRDVRNLVKSNKFAACFPGVRLAADSKAAGIWHVQKDGSDGPEGVYLATGVGGSATGYGGHITVIDDPIKNHEEADSQTIRDRVWNWYETTIHTRRMPDGAIVIVMTRWHNDDLGGRVLDHEPWEVLKLPAIQDEGTDHETALWPEWYDVESFATTRKNPRVWAALYQQEPQTETGTYIKRKWLDDSYYDEPPGPLHIYMAADFAVKEPDSSQDEPDYTEFGVFGVAPDGTGRSPRTSGSTKRSTSWRCTSPYYSSARAGLSGMR